MAWTREQWEEHGWTQVHFRVKRPVSAAFRAYARETGQTMADALTTLLRERGYPVEGAEDEDE